MKNFRNRYPFTIGTTSYILKTKKDNIIRNISYLKKSFDLIQLLFFGKKYLTEVMNEKIMNEMRKLNIDNLVSYVIHLPIDLNLLTSNRHQLLNSIDIIHNIINNTNAFLDIKHYILHIDTSNYYRSYDVALNKKNLFLFDNALHLLHKKSGGKTKKILIENTGYDLTFFKRVIDRYDFSICLDIGHLYINNHEFKNFINTFEERIKLVHLHGFDITNKKDHRSLKIIDKKIWSEFLNHLIINKWPVIIEVFNKNDLIGSLKILEKKLKCAIK